MPIFLYILTGSPWGALVGGGSMVVALGIIWLLVGGLKRDKDREERE